MSICWCGFLLVLSLGINVHLLVCVGEVTGSKFLLLLAASCTGHRCSRCSLRNSAVSMRGD
ncbi:hypothetical protein PVAP13_5KG412114 [Panicum virgatum]|uniref:Secreted protein n=1 Tax=Panicum virgatum TaxID=38727 RepID=A0A8T0SQ01_PANVG|nr:hypothetical protein PVAP13_5KG412114 [Panicum virgatum]